MLERTAREVLNEQAIGPRETIHDPTILAAALKITLQQGRVLCVLLVSPLTKTWDLERKTGLSEIARRTVLHRLRARLSALRLRIISHPGLGYSIPPEDREKINVLVSRFRGDNLGG